MVIKKKVVAHFECETYIWWQNSSDNYNISKVHNINIYRI